MGTEFTGFNNSQITIVTDGITQIATDTVKIGGFYNTSVAGLNVYAVTVNIPTEYIDYTLISIDSFFCNMVLSEDVSNRSNTWWTDDITRTGTTSYTIYAYGTVGTNAQMYLFMTLCKLI